MTKLKSHESTMELPVDTNEATLRSMFAMMLSHQANLLQNATYAFKQAREHRDKVRLAHAITILNGAWRGLLKLQAGA